MQYQHPVLGNGWIHTALDGSERIADFLESKLECSCQYFYSNLAFEFFSARHELDKLRINGIWGDDQARLDMIQLLKHGSDMAKEHGFPFIRRIVDQVIAMLEAERPQLEALTSESTLEDAAV